ncbi:MAG: enhanced serine sensitivity protein SseB [Solobacterium sp.]|nr:enhanced serine sensitivity protein SseB [Solobacterium sp.]
MNIDVNKPVENPKLSTLLKEFSNADPSKCMELQEKIAEELAMHACLLAIVRMDENDVEHNEDHTAVFKKDTQISFVMLQDQNQINYLPVYTDWNEIGKNETYKNMHINTFILSFDDMASITSGKAGIAINPFSDNFIITPENVVHIKQHKDNILRGYSENTVEKDTPVQIGDPADYPVSMVESIKKYAKKEKDIHAIWLKLMIKDNEKSYLLIVDFTGDRHKVFSSIANAASSHNPRGLPIDMVSYADQFGQNAATGKPFYKKKKGLFG